MIKFKNKLQSLFPTIDVNMFCDDKRLAIEIDKYEIFYFNRITDEFKYKFMAAWKAKHIRSLYLEYIVRGDSNV